MIANSWLGFAVMIGLATTFFLRGYLANPSRRSGQSAFRRLAGLVLAAILFIAMATALLMAIGARDGR